MVNTGTVKWTAVVKEGHHSNGRNITTKGSGEPGTQRKRRGIISKWYGQGEDQRSGEVCGAILLGVQRLGLKAYASDLNPIAVMINKAMIEIPPKFAEQKPVGPLPAGEEPLESVQISIEINASTSGDFGEQTQRAVKENCNTLKVVQAEFEE